MADTAFSRRAALPHQRDASRRHRRKRMLRMLRLLAFLCLFISSLIALVAWLREDAAQTILWHACMGYMAFGVSGVLWTGWIMKKGKVPHIRQKPERNRRKNGMVLLVVLVFLSLLSGLTLHLHGVTRQGRVRDERLWQHTRLRAALLDEVFLRAQELANDEHPTVDHEAKPWRTVREYTRPDAISTRSVVQDLNRKFDLNNSALSEMEALPLTTRLLRAAGSRSAAVDAQALRDWMVQDTTGTYDDAYYRRQQPALERAGTLLTGWGDTRWVAGGVLTALQPTDTDAPSLYDLAVVVPTPRERPVPVNINTASPSVLTALMGEGGGPLVQAIVSTRMERPFQSVDALIPWMEPERWHALRPFLSVYGTHFLIEAEATGDSGKTLNVRTIAQRESDRHVRIVWWGSMR